jgi:WhiB family transcriptional regulator, redox-sensing transcriptional regulator
MTGSLQAAEPETRDPRPFSCLDQLQTRPIDEHHKEVTETMSLSVLDAYAVFADGEVDEQELPCRSNDPELFFAESPTDVELAKSLCLDCPVRMQCLAGALERREPWGVWGGELFVQGVVVPRKRPRGRPRKSEVAA